MSRPGMLSPGLHLLIWSLALPRVLGWAKQLLHAHLSARYRNASLTPYYESAAVCKPGLPLPGPIQAGWDLGPGGLCCTART